MKYYYHNKPENGREKMAKKIGNMTLFTLNEVSRKLNISERTLRTYLKTGKMQGQKWGTRIFISMEQLYDYQHKTTDLEKAVRDRVKEISKTIKPGKPAPRKRKKTAIPKKDPDISSPYKLPGIVKDLSEKHGTYDNISQMVEKKTGVRIPWKYFSHWVNEERYPTGSKSVDQLKALCETFKLDFDDLYHNAIEAKQRADREKKLSQL